MQQLLKGLMQQTMIEELELLHSVSGRWPRRETGTCEGLWACLTILTWCEHCEKPICSSLDAEIIAVIQEMSTTGLSLEQGERFGSEIDSREVAVYNQ